MSIADWIAIVAVLISPLLAVQVQVSLDRRRAKKYRKLEIFRVLMRTRYDRVSLEHVEALNLIDIEFDHSNLLKRGTRTENTVREKWRSILSHFNEQAVDKEDSGARALWLDKSDQMFLDLLSAMAADLGYKFDDVQLRRGHYSPVAHSDIAEDQRVIRQSLKKLLSGETPLPVNSCA